ncbi:MAG: Na(+)-translocating NADH-quinone reductase subunit A [Rikenellaceae bacterium]
MSKKISLCCKGLDIKLAGEAAKQTVAAKQAAQYAVAPSDFEGVTPKLLVKVGDKVEAGSALFYNKENSRVIFTSPVSGTVSAINRGEKRKILNVVVDADATQKSKEFKVVEPTKANREQVIELLLESGLWSLLIQRPYGVIANPADMPKAIFVSTFDSAPLAADYNYLLQGEMDSVKKGVEVLQALTEGAVNFGLQANIDTPFASVSGVEATLFKGKHPAGNVGVQIHHVDPINKGEVVWTINIQDLAIVGRFFTTGKLDLTRTIAVTGSEVKEPKYVKVIAGATMESIVGGNVKEQKEGDTVRYISGDVLTGTKSAADGFLGYYSNSITLIPEGDKYEMLGWAMPRFGKFSVSKSYFSWLMPWKKFRLDTNLNGGERAFVVTGLYEKYLPMDVYPMHLLKAIIAGDIDKMEALGIYEVVEEDFALCEFVDPSKTEMQEIIRKGINLMIKEA